MPKVIRWLSGETGLHDYLVENNEWVGEGSPECLPQPPFEILSSGPLPAPRGIHDL